MGDVILQRLGEDVRIIRADPETRVSRELLGTLDPRWADLDGDVLTLRDSYGARYLYRIDWADYDGSSYRMHWPD